MRRNRLRRALIGYGALDDRPIDAPCSRFGRRFAFRRRRRDILEAVIDHGFEGIELLRRLVAPAIAPAAIAVAAFAEGLAAFAPPGSPIAIAPLAIARLAFTTLAPVLSIGTLTAPLIVALGTIAALPIAVTSIAPTLIIPALITPMLIARAAPTRAALTMLFLLLRALDPSSGGVFAAGRYCSTFGPRATTTPSAPARAIAGW